MHDLEKQNNDKNVVHARVKVTITVRNVQRKGGHLDLFRPRTMAKIKSGLGCIVVAGDADNDDLVALKRVGLDAGTRTTRISIYTPEEGGTYEYNIHVMLDTFVGLDASTTVSFVVQE